MFVFFAAGRVQQAAAEADLFADLFRGDHVSVSGQWYRDGES